MFQNAKRNLTNHFGATGPSSVRMLTMLSALTAFMASVTAATFHFRQGVDDGFALPARPPARRK